MESLRTFRESRGIKLTAVAEHLGVSRQTYSHYEKHPERMSVHQAQAACSFLGCGLSDIFLLPNVNNTNTTDTILGRDAL
ncbi:MAG: helix-turn-helix domain-containing protein [Coriobacteriales bacterium]|jgi:putative transcriptional regulator|nr:helix-turn-helix domain-containing protein [Coriobacteriales bacterium]